MKLGQIVWRCSSNVNLTAILYQGIVVLSDSRKAAFQVRHLSQFYGDTWTATPVKDEHLTGWYETPVEAIKAGQDNAINLAARFAEDLAQLDATITFPPQR